MPRIENYEFGYITIKPHGDRDVGAVSVADTGTPDINTAANNMADDIQSIEWNDELTHNPADSVSTTQRRWTTGKVDQTILVNVAPNTDVASFVGQLRAAGYLNTGMFIIYAEYGGVAHDARKMTAIMCIETSREAVDPEGVMIVETAWRNYGDRGVKVV